MLVGIGLVWDHHTYYYVYEILIDFRLQTAELPN